MGGGQPCKAVPSASWRCWDVVGAGPKRGRLTDWAGAHLVMRAPIGDMAAPLWARGGRMMDHGRVGVVVGAPSFGRGRGREKEGPEPREFVAISLLSPSSVSFGRRHWLRLNYDLPAHLQRNAGGWTRRYRYPIPAKLGLPGGCTSYCGVIDSGQTPTFQKGRLSDGRRDQVPNTAARQGRRLA